MKHTLFIVGIFLSIQYGVGQERITGFMYDDEGINALTRTLTELNGALIFNAYTENYGDEMWVYDKQDNLKLLKDIAIGSSSSFPDYMATGFTKYNDEIYFIANDGIYGYELWKTDGIETKIAHDIVEGMESSFPSFLKVHGEYLYFIINKENHYHLCKSDGSNLEIIKDFGVNEYGVAYRVTGLTASGSSLYVEIQGSSLWVSDGTESGTKKVKDFFGLYYLTSIEEKLCFTAQETYQGEKELWVSDGSESGTKMVKNIDGDTSSWPFNLVNFNGTLFFTAYTKQFGRELWKSNGTEEGTVQVIDINEGSVSAFSSYSFCVNENELLFCANNGNDGNELWRTDGTESGTVMIKDINYGSGSSSPSQLTKVHDYTYFQAFDSIHGFELWKTDGTESGTMLVSDVLLGNFSSSPTNIVSVGNEVFFIAESTSFGRQIWNIPHSVVNQLIELINDRAISVYPNPCRDYVCFSSNSIDGDIFIYNAKGQLVLIEKVKNSRINLSDLCSGLYFLKFNDNGKTICEKIVKQ